MKYVNDRKTTEKTVTWEEESGLIAFLSKVPEEVRKFNESFGFGISIKSLLPSEIDGDPDLALKAGFVVSRDNPLMPELRYCLYSLLLNKKLYGYIGLCRNSSIRTVKQLEPVRDFKKGEAVLYEWLRQLVRASCEKITL